MPELPIAPFERMLKNAEKNIRVSEKAAQEFTEFIEDFSRDIAKEIAELTRHSGRKTVLDRDVKIVTKRIGKK